VEYRRLSSATEFLSVAGGMLLQAEAENCLLLGIADWLSAPSPSVERAARSPRSQRLLSRCWSPADCRTRSNAW
jgi:hypothetical protein